MENSGYSDIFEHSPLKYLRLIPYVMALLDQCMNGGELEGQFIRKRTHFQSAYPLHHLQSLCSGEHEHLHLRGNGRAASSAQYPPVECRRIISEAENFIAVSEGGSKPSSRTLYKKQFSDKVQVLKEIAESKRFKDVWKAIVDPWIQEE